VVVMIITRTQIEQLKPYIENVEELIQKDDINELLNAVDDIIIDNILRNKEEPDEPDEEGIRIQKLYDEIYDQN